jgi:hypothetical protein
MARKGSRQNPITSEELQDAINAPDKEIEITGATLKGDFCNYSYEIQKGKTKGDTVNRKGSNIFHEDLKKAFWKLNVHLGCICELIDKNKVKDIEALENIIFEDTKDEDGITIEKDVFNKNTIEDRVTHLS